MAKQSEQARAGGYALDEVSLRILGFAGARRATTLGDQKKGVRREGRKQIQGHLPPVAHVLLDRLAADFSITKQDIFAMAVNEILERLDARYSETSQHQEAAVARQAELWLLEDNPDATPAQIEGVKQGAIEDLHARQREREGEPFRLPIERDLRDPEVLKSRKGTGMGMVARAYAPIGFEKAKANASHRLEAYDIYMEKGLDSLDREVRIAELEKMAAEYPDLAVVIGKWLVKEREGKRGVNYIAKSRQGLRPFCAWFPAIEAWELLKLVKGELGGAPTSTQAVVEAGSRLIILQNKEVLQQMELDEDEELALRVLETGTMDDVVKELGGEPEESSKGNKARAKKS
ncbi:MAG: hypothetical protein VR70_11075 [Rhodospirillaceae bacterium BRH_c57]|nr:MAG: hypothetical protein VR70_11075 [Rhodospirillaceae bacterium BRH_c57]